MQFAIAIPQYFRDGEFDPQAFRAYFARFEELGYDGAWAQEATLGTGPQLSPMEILTYAAACTTRIRLGCTVWVSTLHLPVHFANSLATLDQLSGGRLDVGVGSGGPWRPFEAFGMSKDRYVARFTEGIKLLKTVDARDGHLRRPVLPAHGCHAGAQAEAEAASSALVRRVQRGRAAARGEAGGRVLRGGVDDDGCVRRSSEDAPRAGSVNRG